MCCGVAESESASIVEAMKPKIFRQSSECSEGP